MTEDDEVFMIYQYDEDTDSWVGSYEGQKSPEGGGGACSPDEFLEAVEATADYRSEEDEYKRHKGIDENIYGNTAWDTANKIAQEQFGEFGFASLSEDQMAQIVNIQKANELAEDYYGEFGFATLSEDQMEAIFEKHPDILNTDIKEADTKEAGAVTVQVPFNNIEDQLVNLRDAGIKVVGLEAVPNHNNVEATLQGTEEAIRKYLAKLWFDDETATDQEEISDLFSND